MVNSFLEFKVKTNVYKIEDVRVGHFIDLEKVKASLSGGMYGSMFRMGTVASDEALTMIDMEAFFTVFTPKLLKDLQTDSFRELGFADYRELKNVYVETIVPWYNEYVKSIREAQNVVK